MPHSEKCCDSQGTSEISKMHHVEKLYLSNKDTKKVERKKSLSEFRLYAVLKGFEEVISQKNYC